MRKWPEKVGQTVKFVGKKVDYFWYTDIIANAKKLTKGNTYTVSSLREYSSWTCITLSETGNLEYNHSWFEVIE